MKKIITWCILVGLVCLFSNSLCSDVDSGRDIRAQDEGQNEDEYDISDDTDPIDTEIEEDDEEDDDDEIDFGEEMEDDDENEDESADEDELGDERNKRQAVGVPGPPPSGNTPPPATINIRRRIVFDTSSSADSDSNAVTNSTDGGVRLKSGSSSDEDVSDWFVATSGGYEYRARKSELRSIFSAARFSAAGEPDDGISFDGTPTVDEATVTGDRGPRSVFYPDTRKKVTNPRRFPWSAIGRFDNGCTGFFIGPRHILTAGHCVYSHRTKRWFKRLNFRRQKNCDSDLGVRYYWKYAITVKGWIKYGWASYDYAMVVVTRSSPVRLGYGWKKPIPKWTINIAGYPGDKPGRCMWRSSCKIQRRYSKRLGYRCDTYNGMSGSPVYVYWKSRNRRIAYCIHAHGSTPLNRRNKCVRITKARFNQFKRWINKY